MEVHHMCMESEKKIESSSHWNDYLRSKTIHFSLKQCSLSKFLLKSTHVKHLFVLACKVVSSVNVTYSTGHNAKSATPKLRYRGVCVCGISATFITFR